LRYSVIYLWDENKNFEVKHNCKVCEEIERNVIEPVAVFVPEGQEEKLKEKLLNLSSEELQEELEKLYENVNWYQKNPKNYRQPYRIIPN